MNENKVILISVDGMRPDAIENLPRVKALLEKLSDRDKCNLVTGGGYAGFEPRQQKSSRRNNRQEAVKDVVGAGNPDNVPQQAQPFHGNLPRWRVPI